MSWHLWFAFVGASAVLLVIPGPTVLTVISYALTYGKKTVLPLAVAVALGDATALACSLLGLGALLAAAPHWFNLIRIAGGCYLLYLGMKMFWSGLFPAVDAPASAHNSRAKLFMNTYLVTALNPKAMIFFIAFLPQFIAQGENTQKQLLILAITFVVMAGINATCYAVFSASASQKMLLSPRIGKGFIYLGGVLLTLAGIWAMCGHR